MKFKEKENIFAFFSPNADVVERPDTFVLSSTWDGKTTAACYMCYVKKGA